MAAINNGDMSFMMVSAALVQFMTPGLAFFYGGMVSEENVLTVMMQSFGSMGLITLIWGVISYSLAFAPSVSTGVIGNDYYAGFGTFVDDFQLRIGGIDPVTNLPIFTTITEYVYMVYQLMFAIITSAIISGSVTSKIKYHYFLLFTALWHVGVYCPLAHYIFFYDGFLFKYGALDFAGGLVVHASAGLSALVLTFWLGKMKHATRPHNVTYVMLGTALLWFGWFGFNAGSALAANYLAGRAFVNTAFAPAVAMMTWNVLEVIWSDEGWFKGLPSAVGACTGVIAGLVGITPAAGFVTPMWAFFIGFFVCLPVFVTIKIVRHYGIDDRLDCFALHGIGGITGALLTGLFATKTVNPAGANGGFYPPDNESGKLYAKQIAAICVMLLFSVVGTTVIYWAMWAFARLFGDKLSLDEHLHHDSDSVGHGEQAYGKRAVMLRTVNGPHAAHAPTEPSLEPSASKESQLEPANPVSAPESKLV